MKVSTIFVSILLASVSSAIPLGARSFGGSASTDVASLNHGATDGAIVHTPDAPAKRQQTPNSLKDLVISFLQPLGIPQQMLDLIKNAPDSVVQQIMKLPADQLQNVINQLKEGKIPTVPGIKPKDLVMQFIGTLNIPANVVQQIQGLPDSVFEQIQQLPFSQLQQVISELQQGRIPNIPGVSAPAPPPANGFNAADHEDAGAADHEPGHDAPLSIMDIKF
ncbi:hypothetical protein Dda_5266 [Drechslerella dactyloides]|uniref:Uncharacterized protein n=1 Tax=Drechslerella dactyloides TaxID=74499 RepID=A0AAD6NK20_DREDA|nr:hypothetical protein Dda_5266 [Drechslerella dactyloides]